MTMYKGAKEWKKSFVTLHEAGLAF